MPLEGIRGISSPCLKTLVFPRGFFERNHDEVPFSPSEHVPVCVASQLKLIRINRFFGDDEEYKMFLLEKMDICPWSSESSEGDESEVENEGEEELEVDGDGDGVGGGDEDGEDEIEGDGEGEGQDEDEKDVEFESDWSDILR